MEKIDEAVRYGITISQMTRAYGCGRMPPTAVNLGLSDPFFEQKIFLNINFENNLKTITLKNLNFYDMILILTCQLKTFQLP